MWGLNFKMISIQGLSVNAKYVCTMYIHVDTEVFQCSKLLIIFPTKILVNFLMTIYQLQFASSFGSNCLYSYLSKLVTTTSTFMLVMSWSWNIPAEPSRAGKVASRAELRHLIFWAETELTLFTSIRSKFLPHINSINNYIEIFHILYFYTAD